MGDAGLTLRATLVGLLLAAFVGAIGPYLSLYIVGSNASSYFTSQIASFGLFILVAIVNVVLGRIRRSWMFNKSELVLVFILMSIANATHILVHYWVPMVSSPFYYARSENNWHEVLTPLLPDWLVPHNPEAIRQFFEGAESDGMGIPWAVWLEPVMGWVPAVIFLHVATVALMVIVRRRWVEHERLIYPIMQLPMAMIQQDRRGSLLNPFFKSPVMWIGFSVPMIVGGVIGTHAYLPFVPTIEMHLPFPLFSARLSFATLGFFFLIQREVAFGLWAFKLLNDLQSYIYSETGWGIEEMDAISVWSYGTHSLVHQSVGGMIVLVLGGLWLSRDHLQKVLRKAFGQAPDVDDSDEVMSYRAAVWGLILSCIGLFIWCWSIGISVLGSLTYMFFTFVIFATLTRVVAEGGVAVIYTPMVPADAVVSYGGTRMVGDQGLVGLAFTRILGNDLLNFVMPHVANCLKLAGEIKGSRRRISWLMLLTIFVGTAGAFWMLMNLAYTYGAINLRMVHFVWLPTYVGDYTAARITNPSDPNWLGWLHTGIGSLVMALLMIARRLWAWWPLHPIGFPISSTFHWMAFNAFLAWALKGPIMRYGGIRMYRTVRPFFLGLILGHFTIFVVFWIIDSLTGMQNNGLFL